MANNCDGFRREEEALDKEMDALGLGEEHDDEDMIDYED